MFSFRKKEPLSRFSNISAWLSWLHINGNDVGIVTETADFNISAVYLIVPWSNQGQAFRMAMQQDIFSLNNYERAQYILYHFSKPKADQSGSMQDRNSRIDPKCGLVKINNANLVVH